MSGDSKQLTPEQEATLRHMRREVDALQDELLGADFVPAANTAMRLMYARRRLDDFTRALRKDGYRV